MCKINMKILAQLTQTCYIYITIKTNDMKTLINKIKKIEVDSEMVVVLTGLILVVGSFITFIIAEGSLLN